MRRLKAPQWTCTVMAGPGQHPAMDGINNRTDNPLATRRPNDPVAVPMDPDAVCSAETTSGLDATRALRLRMHDELAREFAWPASLLPLNRPLRDLAAAIDPDSLAAMAAVAHNKNNLTFTLISQEYMQTGLNWVRDAAAWTC